MEPVKTESVKMSKAIQARLMNMLARHEQEKKETFQIITDALGLEGTFNIDLEKGLFVPQAKEIKKG